MAIALAAVATMSTIPASAQVNERLDAAAASFEELMQVPDKSIPEDLLKKAACAVIIPGLKKGAFIVGANYGRGFVLCRQENGTWSAPGGVRVEGGSVGFQIGGTETDVFMLVMNERGADKLLSTKFTVGADATAAAGPLGRQTTAQTDAAMRAEILSWSKSRGVFAGISLQGATLRDDEKANQEMYGKAWANRDIVKSSLAPPAGAQKLLRLISRY